MGMSGADMSMMGMSGTTLFQVDNMGLARTYWYLIAGVLGLFILIRTIKFFQRRAMQVKSKRL